MSALAKCTTTGIGPNCQPGDKGEGEKINCLMHERWKAFGKLNKCIGKLKTENAVVDAVFLLPGEGSGASHAFGLIGAAVGPLNWGQDNMDYLYAGYPECFRTLEVDFQTCYCREIVCTWCAPDPVDDPTGGGTGGGTGGTGGTGGSDPGEATKGSIISKSATLSGSNYLIAIPIVFGSHVVMGNLFWTGDVRQDFTYTVAQRRVQDGISATTILSSTPAPVALVDFAVALCEGPISGIGRIWLADKLIYDNRAAIVNGQAAPADGGQSIAVIEESTTLGTATGTSNVQVTRTEILLWTGSEDQLPNPAFGDGPGAVGYRGLAYLLFKNFNLTSNGGIPQIRVEVIRNVDSSTPYVESQLPNPFGAVAPYLSGIEPSYIHYSPQTGLIVAAANGSPENFLRHGYRAIAYDSLEEQNQADPEITLGYSGDFDFTSTVAVNEESGILVTQVGLNPGDKPIVVVDTYKNVVPIRGVATSPQANGNASVVASVIRESDSSPQNLAALCGGTAITYYWIDKGLTTLDGPYTYTAAFDGQVQASVYLERILAVESGRPSILNNMYHFVVNDADIVVYNTQTKNAPTTYGFVPVAPSVSDTLPASLWGGSIPTIVSAIPVRSSGRVILLISTTSGNEVVLYDPYDKLIVWTSEIDSLPSHRVSWYEYNGLRLRFVSQNNVVYTVDVATGVIEESKLLTTEPLPVGPQFYNGADSSITYPSDLGSAKLARLYIGRIISQRVDIASILNDISTRVGLESNEVDYADVGNLTIGGYIIDRDSSVRAAIDQFRVYFPIEVSEIGGRITAVQRGSGVPYVINTDDFAAGEDGKAAIMLDRVDTFAEAEFVTLGYLRQDQGYKKSRQTFKKPAFLASDELFPNLTNISYEFPFVLTDAEAKAACERIAYESVVAPSAAKLVVGLKHIRLVPGMLVAASINGVGVTGIIKEIEEELSYRQRLTLVGAESSIYGETSSVQPIEDDQGTRTDEPSTIREVRTPIMWPVPLPTAVPSNINSAHLNPMLISPRPNGLPLSTLYGYADNNGVPALFGTFTKTPAVGSLRNKPLYKSTTFVWDDDSQLVIRFDDPEYVTRLVSRSKAETLSVSDTNILIVGRELIRFTTFSVAPDNKTVTFTGLLRGVRGTDYTMRNHVVGELCALYEPEAMQPFTMDLTRNFNLYIGFGFTDTIDTPVEYTSLPVTYYSLAAPIPVNLRRVYKQSYNSAILRYQSRANIPFPYADADDYVANDSSAAKLNFPTETYVYALNAPFDENRFRQYLLGNDPTFVVTEALGADPGFDAIPPPAFNAFYGEILFRTRSNFDPPNPALDAVHQMSTDLWVVVQCLDRTVPKSYGSVNSQYADKTRFRGFYMVYRFLPNEESPIPYQLGLV